MKPKRLISEKKILSYFDEYGQRFSVISFQRRTKEKIMTGKNLNIFEAIKEISLRNTIDTYALLAIDLPEDVIDFEEVKKYRCTIEDFYYGQNPLKKIEIKDEKFEIIDDQNHLSKNILLNKKTINHN